MRIYESVLANESYPEMCHDLMAIGNTYSPRGIETKELHPVVVELVQPRQRLITSIGRMINLPFALAEVVQIIGGVNDAQALKYYNSKIVEIQGDRPDAVGFNAAYGARMREFSVAHSPYGGGGVDQLDHVIQTLRADQDSRQASIVLSHPAADHYSRMTKDRACNVYAHVMIRDGLLDWLQICRSNDVIWGLPYNYCQWLHVMEYVAAQLGVPLGTYNLIQDSLHVYSKQYVECREVRAFDIYNYIDHDNLLIMPPYEDADFQDSVTKWEQWIREGGPMVVASPDEDDYWHQVICVFNSYAAFKRHRDELAYDLLPTNPELRWPLLRNYMQWRWISGDNHLQFLADKTWKELPFSAGDKQDWLQPVSAKVPA